MRKFTTIGILLLLVVSMCAITLSSTVVAAPSAKGVSHRPIQDFIDTQGTYNGLFLSWGTNIWDRKSSVDYAGLDNQAIIAAGGEDLGTTFSGSITERDLGDGTTLVEIRLHTKNALTRVVEWPSGDYIYGSKVVEVIAGEHASLGDCKLDFTYVTTAGKGAPIPDLWEMAVVGMADAWPTKCNFVASSSGELNSEFGVSQGTPGKVTVVMAANFNAPGLYKNGRFFTIWHWPVSTVNVQQVGK